MPPLPVCPYLFAFRRFSFAKCFMPFLGCPLCRHTLKRRQNHTKPSIFRFRLFLRPGRMASVLIFPAISMPFPCHPLCSAPPRSSPIYLLFPPDLSVGFSFWLSSGKSQLRVQRAACTRIIYKIFSRFLSCTSPR